MQSVGNDLGKLVLRLTLGVLLLFHGVHKVVDGIGGIEGMVASHGVPAALAYFVYMGEVLAPVLIVLGLFSRAGGLLVIVNMVVALGLVHVHQFEQLAGSGGWALELQTFYLMTGLSVLLFGAGRFSVSGGRGRWD